MLRFMLLKKRQSDLCILASRTGEIVRIDGNCNKDASGQGKPGLFPHIPAWGKLQVKVGAVETPDCRGYEVPFTPGKRDGPSLVAPDGPGNLGDTVQNESPRCIAVEGLLSCFPGEEKIAEPSAQQKGGVRCNLEKEEQGGKRGV